MLISPNKYPYSNPYNSPPLSLNRQLWEHSSPDLSPPMYLSKMNPIAILLMVGWAAVITDMVL